MAMANLGHVENSPKKAESWYPKKMKTGILMELCWNVTLRPPVNMLKAGALSARQNGLLMLSADPQQVSPKAVNFCFPII